MADRSRSSGLRDPREAVREYLVAAGWQPKRSGGMTVWRNPTDSYYYTWDLALTIALSAEREDSQGKDSRGRT